MACVFGLVCRWFVSARAVLCCAMCALLSVVIWFNRAVIRCNRFPVSGGVVLPCALSCDCGAFYKCLLCCCLMVGWFARSCRVVPSAVGVACVGLRCCVLFGVRMARTGFMYVDIYLYTDGVGLDCGAFSCSCGGVGGLRCCVYGYIKACSV